MHCLSAENVAFHAEGGSQFSTDAGDHSSFGFQLIFLTLGHWIRSAVIAHKQSANFSFFLQKISFFLSNVHGFS